MWVGKNHLDVGHVREDFKKNISEKEKVIVFRDRHTLIIFNRV